MTKPKKPSSKRVVYRVVPKPKAAGWEVRRGTLKVGQFERKSAAVKFARGRAREVHQAGGLAQLVVHDRFGKIQFEATYGADPVRRRG